MIFDCDIGCDDAVALTALILDEKIDVIAITCVHGNLPVDDVVNNALKVSRFCRKQIPVYKGCPAPMVKYLLKGRSLNTSLQTAEKKIDGKEILIHEKDFDLPQTPDKAESRHACSYLVETLRNAQEKIDICAVGPLTNIAMALRLDPSIVNNIGTLYIMGGGLTIGNRTPVAEANFYEDAEAAQIVLTSGIHCLVCPIEPCQEAATYTLEDIDEIEKVSSPISAFLSRELRDYIARCHILFDGDPNSCCIFDYAAVSPLLDETVITEKRKEIVEVDISGGMSDGQMVVDRRGMFPNNGNVEIIYHLDKDKVHDLLLKQLKN